ncbi:hypothetical protein AC249_AIPGENE25484, partial [Exaiptasia diaphana]
MRSYLEQVDVANHIASVHSCKDKTSMLETTVRTDLDFIAPIKTKTVHTSETAMDQPPSEIFDKETSVCLTDDLVVFRRLRNTVNRERKICRAKYYNECKNAHQPIGGRRKKKLSGKEKSTRTHDNIIKVLKNLVEQEQPSDVDIANMVNSTFLAPMKDVPALPDQDSTPLTEPPQKVTPTSVMKEDYEDICLYRERALFTFFQFSFFHAGHVAIL